MNAMTTMTKTIKRSHRKNTKTENKKLTSSTKVVTWCWRNLTETSRVVASWAGEKSVLVIQMCPQNVPICVNVGLFCFLCFVLCFWFLFLFLLCCCVIVLYCVVVDVLCCCIVLCCFCFFVLFLFLYCVVLLCCLCCVVCVGLHDNSEQERKKKTDNNSQSRALVTSIT